jgi:hypothetical protein
MAVECLLYAASPRPRTRWDGGNDVQPFLVANGARADMAGHADGSTRYEAVIPRECGDRQRVSGTNRCGSSTALIAAYAPICPRWNFSERTAVLRMREK